MPVTDLLRELGQLDVPEEVIQHAAERIAQTFDIHDEEIYQRVAAETSGPQWVGMPMPLRPSAPTDAPIYLANVLSYIADGTNDGGKSSGRRAILNHPASRHWGVYVEDRPSGSMYLYHLVFENRGEAVVDSNPDSLTGQIREIALNVSEVANFPPRLGATDYTLEKLQSSAFP
jgi:hypothetical protein